MNRRCGIGILCEDTSNPLSNISSFDVNPASRRCAGIDCPGGLFGNLTIECGDIDYLHDNFRCFCSGDIVNIYYRAPGVRPWKWTVEGLPDGVMSLPDFGCPDVIHIFGTVLSGGRYFVTVTVTDGFGNVTRAVLHWNVIEILTTTIPQPVIGVPYSYQLLATGGSGNYAWRIANGALAPGLTFTMSGLISGTPTGTQPNLVTFRVIDTECEPVTIEFDPPYCELTGIQTITSRVWLGFNEFIASSPPNRYKTLSWTGTLFAFGSGIYAKGLNANMGYCGSTSLDADGNPVSARTESGYSSCHADAFGNCITPGGATVTLTGCLTGPAFAGTIYNANYSSPTGVDWRYATAGLLVRDIVWGIPGEVGYSAILSATQAEKKGWASGSYYATNNDRTVTLSDQYTDAEANARAVNTSLSGLVAFNIARTTGYTDQRASVDWTVNCHNLQDGHDYIATVQLRYSSGIINTLSFTFTASGTDHSLTGNVPIPGDNEWVAVDNPTITAL